jgi:quinol monooxygenase YgiN
MNTIDTTRSCTTREKQYSGDTMKHLKPLVTGGALLAALLGGCAMPDTSHTAQSTSSDTTVVVVTHLDIARTGLDRALGLFNHYAENAKHEPGNLQLDIYRQTNGNHFTLMEKWDNRADYEAHVNRATTREFHSQLDPLLGSPHDERVYREIVAR